MTTATNIKRLLRPHLRSMTPYLSARRTMSGGTIWLNANESPYTPFSANDNFTALGTDRLNRYPNFQSSSLNSAFAHYAGIIPEQVMSHRGSDEGIDLLIRAFCEPGTDSVLICPPTYGMYSIAAQLNNNRTVNVPLVLRNESYQLNLNAIANALSSSDLSVKVIFLCNPSNPLGNLLSLKDIESVLQLAAGKAIVVVDEAYIEYAEAGTGCEQVLSSVQQLNQFSHLVVLRTLSKGFGLAGIRVGFTLANTELIQALVPVLAPYPLPVTSIEVAKQALGLEGLIHMRQNVLEAVSERELLTTALRAFPWVVRIYPSSCNFILMQVDNGNALMSHCQQDGILLRQLNQPHLEHCIRISIGSPAENNELLRVLQNYGVNV